jgi:uncharacterized protein (TIGR02145 family)
MTASLTLRRRKDSSRLLIAVAVVAVLVTSFIIYPKIIGNDDNPNPPPTPEPNQGEDMLTDIEGNVYRTVKIGDQIWMAENLRVTKFNDGTDIKLVTGGWGFTTSPEFCWYDYDPANKDTYGALYNWHVVATGKLAPVGWHVPTEEDWKELTDYLGGVYVAGGKLKERGTAHWKSPNLGATDEYNFTMLPSGTQNYDGYVFYGSGVGCRLWSSDEYDAVNAWARAIEYDSAKLDVFWAHKTYGRSVRLVKDSPK